MARIGLRLGGIEDGFDGCWVEIEGGGVDVGEDGSGSGAEDGADGGEEAERGGDDGVAGADAGGGQRQPEGVGAGGAADGVGHAELLGGCAFKCGDRLTEDKLLRLQYMADGFEQFVVERLVLAFEVEHGTGCEAGAALHSGFGRSLHLIMVPAGDPGC